MLVEIFSKKRGQAFISVIEPPFGLFQIEMEILLGNATVLIEPMFGIRPEPSNAVDAISSFRSAFVLEDDYMVSPNIQECIDVPIFCVIEAAWFGAR